MAGPRPLMVASDVPPNCMSQFGRKRAWAGPETASFDAAPSGHTSPLKVTEDCIT